MMESVKAFGLGAVIVLLPYSVIAVYILNFWDVSLRSRGSFRSLVLAEFLLIAYGSFGAHFGFSAVGEAKSLIWSAISGAVFGLIVGIALPLYTPVFSFLTDLM